MRYPGWIATIVVAMATAVMAVFAVLEYVRPAETGNQDGSPTTAPTHATGTPVGPSTPAGSPDTTTPVLLADLPPVSGGARVVPLPDDLEGEPGYERAVVIECPSNQTGDQSSEVTFETRNRYATFDADLRPYRDPADGLLIDLYVFSDPPDRLPGGEAPGERHRQQVVMGETGTLRGVEIGDAYYLRLRIVCQETGGYMILTGAVLHPAT